MLRGGRGSARNPRRRWRFGPAARRTRALVALAVMAAFGLPWSGCVGVSREATGRRNLLLITIDTLRADHLGCYGYARAGTPRLDRLAAEGALVRDAIAVAPLTFPSHASILTALYPPRHGVRDNADFRLPEVDTTLAEYLGTNGYSTEAVVGSVVLASGLGMAQGFDVYDEPSETLSAMEPGARTPFRPVLERTAAEVTDAALRALEGAREPSFLWVHYFDPHFEYRPPSPFREGFEGRPYDGEIAYTDSEIGRLIDRLEARGLLDRTLVAVTSDHGESLGEHGEETHGLLLYDAALRVPLILRLPGVIPAGRRLAGPVSGVDLAPTLLDLIGLPAMGAIHGRSFAAALRGGAETEPADPVYSESIYPEKAYGWAPTFALRGRARKFIDAPEPEVYDLSADPGETRNLAPAGAREVEDWRRRLDTLVAGMGAADGSAGRTMSDEEREKLASLGYVSGIAPAGARRMAADPKKLVARHNALQQATWLASRKRTPEARVALRRILESDPTDAAALAIDGGLAVASGDPAQGLARLEAAARAAPGAFEVQSALASALHGAGRLEEAGRSYRTALAILPSSGSCHHGLGNVLYATRDYRGAIAEYREAMRFGKDNALVRAALGLALAATGDTAGAEVSLLSAVELDPGLTGAWVTLGLLSEKARNAAQARERYERALAADPAQLDALFNHARVCLGLRDVGAAAKDLESLRWTAPDDPRTFLVEGMVRIASGDREGARRSLNACLSRPGADPRIVESARSMLASLGTAAR